MNDALLCPVVHCRAFSSFLSWFVPVSGGSSIERAMEGVLAAMFNTITDIAKIDPDPSLTRVMEIEGARIFYLSFYIYSPRGICIGGAY